MKKWLNDYLLSNRSLRATLALYFLPITVVPLLLISFYATRLFEESTREVVIQRAYSERDAIVAEIDSLENELFQQAKSHATKRPQDLMNSISSLRPGLSVRWYDSDGKLLGAKKEKDSLKRIDYLSQEGMRKVKARGETIERYFDPQGLVILIRILVKDKSRIYGFLEEEYRYGPRDLSDLKNRRQIDIVLLSRDFMTMGASFALGEAALKKFASEALTSSASGNKNRVLVSLGDNRYAAFLYDLPNSQGRQKKWAYLGVFVPITSLDETMSKLRWALIYLTVLMALAASLAIFLFSNRLVKPIVLLVSAMKRVKTGRLEQLPAMESAEEIEYLVSSFNDMSRNINAAKRTLELKLEELHRANQEIKSTQTTLVQSAKMISLGQIVAGVAHELNNPIAFISSNMHHLNDYLAKIKSLVENYRASREGLSPKERERLEKMEATLEIDYLLKDMEDLIRSCVDGANRTREIVLGLRTFSRMDESNLQMVNLHDGLRSTIRLLASEFKDRIQVVEEFGELPEVECNLSQLNQVFMNLLTNAAHAIPAQGKIWVRTRKEDSEVVVEIEDSGKGILPEDLEKIFDPFFTTKKVGEGTGLGLSIAYGLIQKHQGSISVRSQRDHGTCFEIRLPIRQSQKISA